MSYLRKITTRFALTTFIHFVVFLKFRESGTFRQRINIISRPII